MAFVVGTFVLVVGIVYGLYWLLIEREDSEQQNALRKRLKRPTAKSVITEALLKDKERLLSLEEPVRFLFSHSALREGWDNPNVFVMGMLKKSDNTISRRQERQ